MKDILKIKDLEQVRLLSDPFKLQLIQAFAESEKTTKEVAAELGESVTKLYRHVDALVEAGLISVSRETRKRGTIERTFRAAAKQFEADPDLFSEEQADEAVTATRELLRAGENELIDAIANASDSDPMEPIFVRLRLKGSSDKLNELRSLLTDWVATVQEDSEDDGDEDLIEAGAMVAFYFVDSSKKD